MCRNPVRRELDRKRTGIRYTEAVVTLAAQSHKIYSEP